jgi:cellulose synthase (UDP-forming)
VDTWRLFLFDNPIIKRGLSVAQRLQYLELGLFYLTAVFFLPLLIFTPLLSIATGDFVSVSPAALLPWMTISVLYYIVLARGQSTLMLRMLEYWIGHWPTYTKAFWVALRSRTNKPKYVVTRKTRENGFYGRLLWPQFLYLALGVIMSFRALFLLPQVELSIRVANVIILGCFMFMVSRICRAAFYGVRLAAFARQEPEREEIRERARA